MFTVLTRMSLLQSLEQMLANKSLPKLDMRLSTVADLVPSGSIAADIGCDHGKLAAVLSAKCKKVIAIDSAVAPLAIAKEQMRKSNAVNVECRLGYGISALSINEADTIIIAGLSAKTICDILAAAPWVKQNGCRLIFVPATKPHELREWLCENGFELKKDIPVKAAGRYYAVLCAEYCATPKSLSLFESIIGKLCGVHRSEYLRKEAFKMQKTARRDEYAHYALIAERVLQEAENGKCE